MNMNLQAPREHSRSSKEKQESRASTTLRNYYFLRASIAFAWAAAAFTVGAHSQGVAVGLLIAYPLWDAAANLGDARRSGGFALNMTQTINVAVSAATAVGVGAFISNMNRALAVFGAWAIFAGALQLVTALRRRKTHGAQWAMVLSGAQSALAGGFFIKQSLAIETPSIVDIAPYAAFGGFYFLISALALLFLRKR